MGVPLLVHVSAGAVALVTGYTALFAAKGGLLHRHAGRLFIYAIVIMGITGAAIAGVLWAQHSPKDGLQGTFFMGVLTAYLAVTALTAVRPPSRWSRRIDLIGLPVAAAIGVAQLTLGVQALASPDGHQIVMLTTVELVFGAIALLAAASDFRIIRSGPPTGAKRIARHLWRMSLALWVAAMSFSPRLIKFTPVPLRPLLFVPALAVLALMGYWMWRVRYRKSFRGLIGVTGASASAASPVSPASPAS